MSGFRLDEDLVTRVERGSRMVHRVWEPPGLAVVLGRASRPDLEVHLDACRSDGIPVLRRLGGGGAVVLGPGCLVLSFAKTVGRVFAAGSYMEASVGVVADALWTAAGVRAVPKGTGDLCLADRKILGSSVFRRRRILFYQASLLVSMDLGHVERYLAHPPREPSYRAGRPHGEFLTTLHAAGHPIGMEELIQAMDQQIPRRLPELR